MEEPREVETIMTNNLNAQLSGAWKAEVFGTGSPRVVRLTYLDGETEETYLTIAEIAAGKENWFAMVGAVQAARTA